MDNRVERIGALRRYIALLRQEETRLIWIKGAPATNAEDRADAESRLIGAAQKIHNADKELRGLENRRL
jgi:hypothetical protein